MVFLKKYGLLGTSNKPESKMTHDEEVLDQDQLDHLVDARRT
jgi:hypothetical protein